MSEAKATKNQPQTDIPVQAFADLVAQYHHRLLSLEAELKDRARAGKMSTALFSRRVKRLKEVHAVLGSLQRLCIAESPQKASQSDIGLPDLSECTPEEMAVVERFLREREGEIFTLEEQTAKVHRWLAEAAVGKAGALKITLRLSKLRVMIQSYDKRLAAVGEQMRAVTKHCDKLVVKSAENGLGGGREMGRGTIECLMDLFQSLDGTIQRVARLKAALKKEESKTEAVSLWLTEQEEAIARKCPAAPPPTPLATTQALRRLPSLMRQTLERTRRRKDLVERFWEDVVRHGDAKASAAAKTSSSSSSSSPRMQPEGDL